MCPPLSGQGVFCAHECGISRIQVVPRTFYGSPCFAMAKRSGPFCFAKYSDKENSYAQRITQGVRSPAGGAPDLPDVDGRRLLQGGAESRQEALFHRDAAPQRHWPAAHGPRHGRHPAGHPHPLQADAGVRGPVAARHGPRRHRHPDQGGGEPAPGGPDPL